MVSVFVCVVGIRMYVSVEDTSVSQDTTGNYWQLKAKKEFTAIVGVHWNVIVEN